MGTGPSKAFREWASMVGVIIGGLGLLVVIGKLAQYSPTLVGMVMLIGILALAFVRGLAESRPNPEVICPHCQIQGHVHLAARKEKAGISGGKATGAILTGGVSLLATGLSRTQKVTKARCGNCGTRWTIA